MMDYKKAISIFKKKYPKEKVFGYVPVKGGVVIGATSGFARIECTYFLVTPDGRIKPTYPTLTDWDPDKFVRI